MKSPGDRGPRAGGAKPSSICTLAGTLGVTSRLPAHNPDCKATPQQTTHQDGSSDQLEVDAASGAGHWRAADVTTIDFTVGALNPATKKQIHHEATTDESNAMAKNWWEPGH